ncbi:Isocitrate lyase, partial [Tetrabaena socialis]
AVAPQDQLASAKKCGHMGGKVLVPTREFVQKLTAARLAADVMDVPTIIVARTDALGAFLLTSDADERDKAFLTGERTPEGYFCMRGGIESAIARGLAYAPFADMVWFETGEPNMEEAKSGVSRKRSAPRPPRPPGGTTVDDLTFRIKRAADGR